MDALKSMPFTLPCEWPS